MIETQKKALREQDEKMRLRVEKRLKEITDDFLKRTEIAAQLIFDKNHKIVFSALDNSNQRVDEICAYHKVQKKMFDDLFEQNAHAIVLHNEVKKIFKEESEAFFSERQRWKTDAQKQIHEQDVLIRANTAG